MLEAQEIDEDGNAVDVDEVDFSDIETTESPTDYGALLEALDEWSEVEREIADQQHEIVVDLEGNSGGGGGSFLPDFEVREFEWHDDTETLIVRGCYFSQMADSKLITIKAMLEDIHGDLVEEFLAANRLRGRISKMGLQIQKDVVNEEAEADERGMMNPKTAVKTRFDDARADAEENATDGIQDVNGYVEDYADEHGIDTVSGPPQTRAQAAEQAATDGGTEA